MVSVRIVFTQRDLDALRAIREMTGISLQSLIRQALAEFIPSLVAKGLRKSEAMELFNEFRRKMKAARKFGPGSTA